MGLQFPVIAGSGPGWNWEVKQIKCQIALRLKWFHLLEKRQGTRRGCVNLAGSDLVQGLCKVILSILLTWGRSVFKQRFRSLLSYKVSQALWWRTLSSVEGLFRTGRTSNWYLLPHQDVPCYPESQFHFNCFVSMSLCRVEMQTLIWRSQNK